MSELDEIFNRFKNLLYDNSYKKYKLTDIAVLLKKEDKSEEDVEDLRRSLDFISTMHESIEDLGTKIGEINSIESQTLSSFKRIEEHIRDIILYMDQFIDALVAFTRLFDRSETKFNLKKSSTYLKAIRGNFVKKASEFKIKTINNEREQHNLILLINDSIDVFLKESYSLRVSILAEKIHNSLEEYDRKHSDN